jgi:hypothetical protein
MQRSDSEIFTSAAQLIDRCGLAKGVFGNSHLGYCTIGALQHVTGLVSALDPELKAIEIKLAGVIDGDYQSKCDPYQADAFVTITDFNDNDDTTKNDVVQMLRKAAHA